MTTLEQLRDRYRKQHESMVGRGDVCHTTRRQTAFRPLGRTYYRLLKIEMHTGRKAERAQLPPPALLQEGEGKK